MKLVSTPRRIITRAVVEVASMSLVRVEKLDERLEQILRSSKEPVVSINLEDLKTAQVAEFDFPEEIATTAAATSSERPCLPGDLQDVVVKDEPIEYSGDQTEEIGVPMEWCDEAIEETIAPVEFKQERSMSPERDRQHLIPCSVNTMAERKSTMARGKPRKALSSVDKRKRRDPDYVPKQNQAAVAHNPIGIILRSRNKTPTS